MRGKNTPYYTFHCAIGEALGKRLEKYCAQREDELTKVSRSRVIRRALNEFLMRSEGRLVEYNIEPVREEQVRLVEGCEKKLKLRQWDMEGERQRVKREMRARAEEVKREEAEHAINESR